jgi:hypothetical protein
MNYRLVESYYTTYPLTAPLWEVKEFACYYTIDYTFTGRNYLKVDVLEDWTHETKPIGISAAMKLPIDLTKTKEQNATPDDRWLLVFQKQNAISIGHWKAKTLKEQAEYLGEKYTDPDAPEDQTPAPPNPDPTEVDKKGLFASNNPHAKTNGLWLILATVITAAVGVSFWAYRRYRRTKRMAERVALKYGKYSQDVADALT